MRKRDRDIIDSLVQFRALSRDQVAELFFSHTKKPVTNANFALKRLRDRGLIEAYTKTQPYTYFPKPCRIKKDGQKVNHFVAIADFYLQLKRAGGELKFFHVEPGYTNYVRPDICVSWKDAVFFVEIQCSHYTQEMMDDKMKRYREYFKSDEWKDLRFQRENSAFPNIWIVADHTYKIEKKQGMRVLQTKDVKEMELISAEAKGKHVRKAETIPKTKPVPVSTPVIKTANDGVIRFEIGARGI